MGGAYTLLVLAHAQRFRSATNCCDVSEPRLWWYASDVRTRRGLRRSRLLDALVSRSITDRSKRAHAKLVAGVALLSAATSAVFLVLTIGRIPMAEWWMGIAAHGVFVATVVFAQRGLILPQAVPTTIAVFVATCAVVDGVRLPYVPIIAPTVPLIAVLTCTPRVSRALSLGTMVAVLAGATLGGLTSSQPQPIWIVATAVGAVVLATYLTLRLQRGMLVQLRAQREEATRQLDRHHQTQAALLTRLSEKHRMESLGTLAAGVAHDFNNILAVIHMTAQSQDTEEAREIQQMCDRASGLCAQLLDFSEQSDAREVEFDAVEQTESCVKMVRVGNPGRVVLTDWSSPFSFRGDPVRFGQIVVNLVQNALDASSAQVRVSVARETSPLPIQVRGSELPAGTYLRLSVIDEGPGIPATHLEQLFDPFFTTRADGRGLGLATVLDCVHMHRGGIAVNSGADGTTFEVLLPMCERPTKGRARVEAREELAH